MRFLTWSCLFVVLLRALPWSATPIFGDGPPAVGDAKATLPPGARKVGDAPIENLFRLSERMYSGAAPEGAAAFETLAKLGVRTVISVDGAAPDVAAAKQAGMRYVHVPIGYDGVPTDRALTIIKAAQELPGPVYVHCHHGKHRGPAAAALCIVAIDGWSRDQAVNWMKIAGTAPEYRGLYHSVEKLTVPTADELRAAPADFPERAPVSTLVETMVKVDMLWDRLKADADSKFVSKASPGEVSTSQAALQLAELFREMARSETAQGRGPAFVTAARTADRDAAALERALLRLADSPQTGERDAALAAFQAAGRNCKACHATFRDGAN